MPSAAAALVTSPSLAAPSSIEYSVCTCRCTKFSEAGVLTLRGAPHGSCGRLFPRREQGRRSIWVTGGEGRSVLLAGHQGRCTDPRTSAVVLRGSDRTCLGDPDHSVTAVPLFPARDSARRAPASPAQGVRRQNRGAGTCSYSSSRSHPVRLVCRAMVPTCGPGQRS